MILSLAGKAEDWQTRGNLTRNMLLRTSSLLHRFLCFQRANFTVKHLRVHLFRQRDSIKVDESGS